MQIYNYISIETIFAKFSRDLRNADLHESDIIEWTGEALGFMKLYETQEEAVAFIEVNNYRAQLPNNFQSVIQVAKYNHTYKSKDDCMNPCCVINAVEGNKEEIIVDNTNACKCPTDIMMTDCQGNIIGEYEAAYYRPMFDLKWEYQGWINSNYYKNSFMPVRLSNNAFLKSVVCTETMPEFKGLYTATNFEYTFAGHYPNLEMRFNFEKGYIALAFLRSRVDSETGYPLIPDDASHISAIMYYIKWKMAERFRWEGREGFAFEAKDAEEKWLRYVRQANNKTKMPHGVDQYQNLKEQSIYLIPADRKFHSYFGVNRRLRGLNRNQYE